MPHYTVTLEIARPLPDMFAFFTKPRNLLQFSPPDYNLELVTGPEVLALGERLVWQGRRWGIAQKLIQEVATFDIDKLIIVEQKQGPFKRWVQAHHFEPSGAGTRIIEKIDFDPPGGMLGFVVTANSIRKELDNVTAYRAKKLAEIFRNDGPRER
jgi:ligand-binding SRPBCC domain-containing protein